MHTSTALHRRMALALGLALLAPTFASAQCSAAMESCSASCDSAMTSGFIVGMAGALGRNSSAYQQGQNQLQQAQACAQRCSAQYDACNQREEAQRQQEESMRRAQQQAEAQRRAEQQRADAQRQAQERAQAERQALRQRVNRVISPPVLPPLAIKDAAPLLAQAQEHEKDGNPAAAAAIYKMVVQGGSQPRHQQAARAALRAQALDEFTYIGTREPGAYARTLAEYGALGVFPPVEQAQIAAMEPTSEQAEDAARDYLRKNPKGALRGVAEAVAQAAPQLRARETEEKRRLVEEQRLVRERAHAVEQLQRAEAGATGFAAIDTNGHRISLGNHACVKDGKTGLLWSTEALEMMNWDGAMRAGNGYSRCGFNSGWRLPSREEMLSLAAQKSQEPATYTRYFPGAKTWFYWTRETSASDSAIAWYVNFTDGNTGAGPKTGTYYARLVRSGQ